MADPLKIVFIGAASPQWGYTIARDIIVTLSNDSACAKRNPILVLEDIDAENLARMFNLAEMLARRTGNRVRVEHTTNQKEALKGANFVVTSLAVGSLEAMQHDIEIPREYGIYMPVGDTISIGGAIRAARNIPAFLSIAHDMEAVAAPGAWLLNLSNPMSMLTRAVTRETSVRAVGLCHELYGGLGTLSRWLGFDYSEWKHALQLDVVGINHCGWLRSLKIDGEDGFEKLHAFFREKGVTAASRRLYDSDVPELRRANVKIELFLKYGVFPYSGDRHNVEFFAEFCSRETNLGADYGVLLTPPQERLVEWRGRARQSVLERLAGKQKLDLTVSEEATARIIKAIAVDDPFYDVGNLPYTGGALPGIPEGAVIERMCTYDGNGAHPVAPGPLPDPLQGHMEIHARNIEEIISASVNGDRDQMIAALLRDPLLENMDHGRIPEMWDRLADVHREYLHPGLVKKA